MPGDRRRALTDVAREHDGDSPRRGRRSLIGWLFASTGITSALLAAPAYAANGQSSALTLGSLEVAQLAMFAGAMGAAFFTAIYLIHQRSRIASDNDALRTRVAEMTGDLRRYDALMNFQDQRIIYWPADSKKPEIAGSLAAETGAPDDRAIFLAFGRWLAPQSAAVLDRAINELRENKRGFEFVVQTQTGAPLEVQGRYTPTYTLVRFVAAQGAQLSAARLRLENQQFATAYSDILNLLNNVDSPFWVRGADGQLKWVNQAYAKAVDAETSEAAVKGAKELLSTRTRESISNQHRSSPTFVENVSTVIGGNRHILAVVDQAGQGGSAGIGLDISEVQALRDQIKRADQIHSETLNRLTTAVAIFDGQQKLRFYNQAFQRLWDLDASFLDSAPENNLLLDKLRSEGKIGERPDWRKWKDSVLEAYRAVQPAEDLWHLPDNRTLRVIANPEANGGVTWVFEDLTEQIHMESRYKIEVKVRSETLDNLAEGVAVFGMDGKLKLFNPAFLKFWGIDPESAPLNTHISTIQTHGDAVAVTNPWRDLAADITGFDVVRRERSGQIELKSGHVLRYALTPLPNGQVMVTFVDMTDSVNVERALHEKNEALQHADQLKNDFIQHVSYELRSPLTNIRGFAELLEMPVTGPLNERQGEYVRHIGSSSQVLSTIIDDILDLATVDAGIMQLDISEVHVRDTIDAAAGLIAERMGEHNIHLDVDTTTAPVAFQADEVRLRQVLYNLLSNAVNFAPPNSTIRLSCRQANGSIEFSVHDDGPGMSEEVKGVVFSRFESRANGGRRRGAGLGLSLVKSFVELHGGAVKIETGAGVGTTVTCRFPLAPSGGVRQAAE